MQVGDLVKFTSGYTGVILEFTELSGVSIYVNGADLPFKNPTYMSMDLLKRSAEVINELDDV